MTPVDANSKAQHQAEPLAARVAAELRAAVDADLVILFGSRARGEHDALRSDIDIMLLQETEPELAEKEYVSATAATAAQNAYGRDVEVQLVWRDLATFRRNRRYTNSVETNAVREGIIMPRSHEEYSADDYEDDAAETEYDWGEYDIRLGDAETHLDEFKFLAENGRSDMAIGQHAQSALEHALKALLSAHGAPYRSTHDIGELLGNARYRDPELEDFRLAIPPDIYTEYAGRQGYSRPRRNPRLEEQENFKNKTITDAQFIIDRAREVRRKNEDSN